MKIFRNDILENLWLALATLRDNKLRSFLTVIGVIIGVVTVMLIASIISGIDTAFTREVESFGTRSMYISKNNPGIHVGRLSREERMRKPVAVIGVDIRDALFAGASPIGRMIRVSGTEFTVIGVLERQGSSFGRSLDNPVYMPITVYNQMYGGQKGAAVFGKARPGSSLSMGEALDVTRAALRSRFHTDIMEMESAPLGHVCQTLGVPYLIVRAGSNVAQEAPNDDYLRLGPIAAREAAKFSLHLLGYL